MQHAGIHAETIENPITELRRNYGVAGYIRAVRTLHPAVFAHSRAHAQVHENSSCARNEKYNVTIRSLPPKERLQNYDRFLGR